MSLSLCRVSKPCSESTVQFRLGSSRSRRTKQPMSNQTEAVTLSEPTWSGQGGPAYTAANSSDSGHSVSPKDGTQVTPNEGPRVCLFYTSPAKFINSKKKKLTRVCSCPTTAGPFFLINYCTKFPPTFSFCFSGNVRKYLL